MKAKHTLAGALLATLLVAGCGGGSGGSSNSASNETPPADPTVTALSGMLPGDTAVDAAKPLPDSLQSPENLGSASPPDADQMAPG